MPIVHQTTRCFSTSYSLNMPRQVQIRRLANRFEDILQENYGQPVILPVMDEMDPSLARIIFQSKNGFSQIAITQNAIGLNINYSPDAWQTDSSLRENYISERVNHLFDLVSCLDGVPVQFSGIINQYQIQLENYDQEINSHIADKYMKQHVADDSVDIVIKLTKVLEGRFFSNVQIQNYRIWPDMQGDALRPLSYESAASRGVALVHDLNDRLAFNERPNYVSDLSVAREMLRIAPLVEGDAIANIVGEAA